MSREGDYQGALAQVDEGIKAAGSTPELIEKKADILLQIKPADAVEFLDSALGGPPKTPSQFRVLIQATLAAGQTDRAREAVQKCQELLPHAAWLTVQQAKVELQAGRPTDAVITLRKVLPLIPRDPLASGLYVRAQCACGAAVLAEQFLNELMDQHKGSTIAILEGCTALTEAGHVGLAVRVLRRLAERETFNQAATVALAESLSIQAEYRPTGWTRPEIDEALSAYRAGLRKFPEQLEFASRIAWIELMALDSPRQAYGTAAPLRTAEKLSPEAWRTVGATCAYVGEYDKAQEFLTKSLEGTRPRASTLALHGARPTWLEQARRSERVFGKSESR